jgi:hypothetical protein
MRRSLTESPFNPARPGTLKRIRASETLVVISSGERRGGAASGSLS